eukprot:jgi/Psemu1/32890/gm1.32890_g
METKTSYSSMAAKPPSNKANDATTTGPTKAKNPSGPKRNPDRFLGHNQTDLKGILIPEDASAKHYHELKDRLETLGGLKYIPQVGSSIEHLTRFERKDFVPTKPTGAKYSTTVTDPGYTNHANGGELKKKADEWIHYQRDMEKMYCLALGQIDDGMKAKLKGLKSWKTIDTSKCIVELLKAVRDLCFQSSRTKVHPVTNMLREIWKLLCTQQRSLDAASYVKMMKENLDVVKSLGGTLICKATVTYELETNPLYASYDYTTYLSLRGTTTRTAIDHAVEQRALAALIIDGSDTDSSNLKQVLADNYALQQNNYPATSVEALDMVKDEQSNQESTLLSQQGVEATDLSNDQHSRQLLMTAVESGETFTPSPQTMYMFLNIGMTSQDPGTSSLATYTNNNTDSNSQEDSNIKFLSYYFGQNVEYLFSQSESEGGVNPYWILLDSQSSLNLIVNPALTNLVADLPGFGVVWFYADGLANVLSLALVIDNALYVHKDGGTRRFKRSTCNLYYCDMREHNGTVLALDTVEGKANSYSALDCSRAKKARDMQEILGFPTTQELVKMIDNNIIKDCPITRRDIKIMTDIYGKHASLLKGKSVRQQAPHTREDITPIPDNIQKAYHDVVLCVDIITVNGMQFLVSISCHIRLRTAIAITNMKQHILAKTIRAIAGQYAARGLRVAQVHADNQFECIRESLLDMEHPITVHCVPAGQHEPTIERSNRTLKENIRCVMNHIPVRRLPGRCMIELVYATTFWLNCRTTGVSPTMSPQEIMTGVACNARTHGKFQFFQYIQAHCEDTNNTMKPRPVDAIYLRPTGQLTDGFYAYDINTGQRIHRKRAIAIPMPQVVIDKLESNALEQGMPTGLEFEIERPITILDLDTKDNQDDDDASDQSYTDNNYQDMDEESLVSVIDENEAIADSNQLRFNIPDDNDATPPDQGGVDAAPTGEPEGGQDEPTEAGVDIQSTAPLPPNNNDTTNGVPEEANEDTLEDAAEANGHNTQHVEDNELALPEEEDYVSRLQPRVTRSHNKFGLPEGYTSEYRERSGFTAGYSNAI